MEEQIIEEVRKYNIIYNLNDKDYRNVKKRQEVWEEIGEKVNKTWQESRDAWTKLRNAYTNALKRRKTADGQAAKKIPKWKFEEEMSFLAAYMEPRPSLFEPDKDILQENKNNKNATDDVQANEEYSDKVPDIACNPPGNPNIEKSMADMVEIMKSSHRLIAEIVQPPEPSTVENDEIDMFFTSLAKTTKKLPHHEQIYLKMGISKLVFEAELRNTLKPDQEPQPPERNE